MSGLSDNEYVHLVGHINRLLLNNKTVDEVAERGYTREQLEAMHEAMKKRKPLDVPEVRSLNVSFRCDLKRLRFPEFNYLYSMYAKYDKHGVLPYNGSHSEQPAKIIEIFDVISSVHAEEETRMKNK